MLWESSSYLAHYGVKGQKHGLRRYQNEDGTLTAEGRDHYGIGDPRKAGGMHGSKQTNSKSNNEDAKAKRRQMLKKVAIGVGSAATAAAIGYRAYKKSTKLRDTLRETAREKASDLEWKRKHMNDNLQWAQRNLDLWNKMNFKQSDSVKKSIDNQKKHVDSLAKIVNKMDADHKKYSDIAINATRRDVVKNLLKNKGKLKI